MTPPKTAIDTYNPTTGERIESYLETTPDEIAEILRSADALVAPARRDVRAARERRKAVLLRAADLLDRDLEVHARLITTEMGKTLQASRDEVKKCAASMRTVVAEIDGWLTSKPVALDGGKSGRVEYHPLGVLLAVMPWNFPYWQVIRAFIPAALLGNPFILKHASNVSGCAKKMEALFREAGAEEGLFQVVLLRGDKVLPMAGDPRVRAVTLTGSEPAGRAIAEVASRGLKKVVLELGGSDPFIVTETADVAAAAVAAAKSRLLSNGQSCVCAKRFIVHTSKYAEFKEVLLTEIRKVKMGSPFEPDTGIGPLVNPEAKEHLETLRDDALKNLASELYRAENPFPAGSAYYPITVFESIPKGARLRTEEAFGPHVLALFV